MFFCNVLFFYIIWSPNDDESEPTRQRPHCCIRLPRQNCALNGYTFVNLSQYIEEWGKQECAMYQTAFNRVLRKESPYDMHYVSELMAIALLRALATDTTTLLSWQTVKRLTKRLHRQYMSHGKTIKRRRCTL